MNIKEIYQELQLIDEYHANFNPTDASRNRIQELTHELNTKVNV